MRLFIAIEPSPGARRHLLALQNTLRPLADVSWVKPDNLHLTLKFLGEVPDSDVAALCQRLAAIAPAGAFDLVFDRLVCFPERGPARVISAGASQVPPALPQLAERIEEACGALGLPREARPWHAHLTLARARRPLPPVSRQRLEQAARSHWPAPAIAVTRFVLVQSVLTLRGPQYIPAAHFDIKLF